MNINTPVRVFVIEDDVDHAEIMKMFLEGSTISGFDVKIAGSMGAVLELTDKNSFDVVLADLTLPDSKGIKTFLKVQQLFQDKPVIVVTAMGDENLGIEAVKLGAQDFIQKDQLQSELLARSILYAIERKTSEIALKESESRYRLLFEESPISLWEEDFSEIKKRMDGLREEGVEDFTAYLDEHPEEVIKCASMVRIIDVNKKTLELFGARSKQELLDSLDKVFTSESYQALKKQLVALVAGVTTLEFEGKNRTMDGREITCSFQWVIAPGHEKAMDKVILSLIDITDRKHAEAELERNRKLVDSFFEHSPLLIFVKDLDGRFIMANRRMEELFGVEPSGLKGLTDFDLYGDDIETAERMRENDRFVIQAGEPIRFEEWKDVGGRRRHYVTVKFPLKDESGRVNAIGGMTLDVTDQKLAEERLKAATEDLRRSNAELEQFAYVASHDLQEPLRMVHQYMTLLERRYSDKLDDNARDFIGFAVDGADRMQKMIEALLQYSRINTRGRPFEEFDSGELLDEVLSNLEVAVRESGAVITHDHMPTIRADRDQISRLLQNLISNAIKFRGDSAPEIHISAVKGDNECRFSIRDNGIGIRDEDMERVFKIFQRLHGRHEIPGAGIGLSVAKRIVERHKGLIWIESSPGRGSTFHFTLHSRTFPTTGRGGDADG